MRVDAQSHVPIYVQIVEGVRHAVVRGVYRAGEALPSVRELAVTLGVNPNTVQRAYESLEREGLIASRRGLGMFVEPNGLQSARAQSVTAVSAALDGAVGMGRAADMPRDGLQLLFNKAMERAFPKELKR